MAKQTTWIVALVVLAVPAAIPGTQQPPDKKQPGAAPNQVRLNGHTFTLPPGFEIELVAGPPLVERPITADFDEQGRLYVSDSSGSNEKVAVQLEKKPHRIVRLVDTDGDGKFDKATVFADKMMFPEGTMWLNGSLYVAAPPSIWKLTDTDGDGVADKREEWFKGKTLTGCANDLHGPYRGPDGWIYWCKGAFAPQTYELPGKGTFKTRAAHVFRARPDGSGVEPVMTGGMDNPVDLVFTPGGERIFTTTFFQFPGNGRRDGLVHAVYGGVYGKDWDVIHEPQHKWTGPTTMPVLTHLGPAAPAGLHRYESKAFGREYENNLFAALFNLRKVTRHVLIPDGATFKTRDEDFVVSDNVDFHPTDVIEDADGSLLIVDTGGWYKLCCPTSQLVKPDVRGAIYRVRKKGMPKVDDPRGLKLAWRKLKPEELAKLLGDPRPAVRRRAVETLGAMGEKALTALWVAGLSNDAEVRRNAVWATTRIDGDQAREFNFARLTDADETVRQAALHSIAVRLDSRFWFQALWNLDSKSPQNQRAAAEALARFKSFGKGFDEIATSLLLKTVDNSAKNNDRVLEHSLIYALIEIANPSQTASGLENRSPHIRRASLIALDQMGAKELTPEVVTRELAASDARLRETAWWIASRHPEWGAKLSGFVRQRLADSKLTDREREDLLQQLVRLTRSPAIQSLLAEEAARASVPKEARRLALQAMARASMKETPSPWLTALTLALNSSDADVTATAAATARAVRWPKQRPQALVAALQNVGTRDKTDAAVRLTALAALPDGLPRVEDKLFDFLRDRLRSDRPPAERGLAAETLARAKLDSKQLLELARSLKTVGPMEANRLLDAFARSGDEAVGTALVEALKSKQARAWLTPESARPRLAKYSPAIRKQAEAIFATLGEDVAKQQARLDTLIKSLPAGDVRRGQIVFNSPKASCMACHTIGYVGGKIGPDLTRIGSIRTERDLLESIVFPSASFVRGYEPVYVRTQDGKTYNGILRRDAPDEIMLVPAADKEERIARADIEELRPGRVSVMPSGLDQQLSRQELADLVAFLKASR